MSCPPHTNRPPHNPSCSIDYEVLAYVEVPGVFSANIRHRQLLAVSAATDVKAIRAESVERVKKVRWVLFFFFGLFLFLFVSFSK